MNRERIRMIILLSKDTEEADKIITDVGFESVKEKIAFLKGMFDFSLIGRQNDAELDNEASDRMDYYAILSTILNSKWGD